MLMPTSFYVLNICKGKSRQIILRASTFLQWKLHFRTSGSFQTNPGTSEFGKSFRFERLAFGTYGCALSLTKQCSTPIITCCLHFYIVMLNYYVKRFTSGQFVMCSSCATFPRAILIPFILYQTRDLPGKCSGYLQTMVLFHIKIDATIKMLCLFFQTSLLLFKKAQRKNLPLQ